VTRRTTTWAVVGALIVVAAVVIAATWRALRPPPPAARTPARPAPPAPAAVMRYSPVMYRGLLEQDARDLGLPPPASGEMAAPFPYFDELAAPRVLRPGAALRPPHLALSLAVRREEGAIERTSFRADHLVLSIENLTAHHLAYRISTRVLPRDARCGSKGDLPHDAVALAPRETLRRTECLHQRGGAIEVVRAEVLEIPRLSYYYVSRLTPGLVLYDARAAAGHRPPHGDTCPQTLSWREIRDGAARGDFGWRDVIDFYARHSCLEYAFFPAYRHRADPTAPLPARPPDGPSGGGEVP
jgi:hypothetical protein